MDWREIAERLRLGNASEDDKALIRNFYRSIFGKYPNENCHNCLMDALFELKNMKTDNRTFLLPAGVVLLDPVHDEYNCSHNNITDEKAIYHLKRVAHDEKKLLETLKKFWKYPDNWRELVYGPEMTEKEIKKELIEKWAFIESDFKGKNLKELLIQARSES